MKFNHNHYVPCLRWKQGEYQAVTTLSSVTKDYITPLLEVPEMGFDFEKKEESKTIDEHLAPFAKRILEKWGKRECFVDLSLIDSDRRQMEDGRHPVLFVFEGLNAIGCRAIPVTGVERGAEYQEAIASVIEEQDCELCIRLRIEDASATNIRALIDAVLKKTSRLPNRCHCIVDLGAPSFAPVEGFAKLVEAVIRRLPYLQDWQTVSLIGTAFPESMGILEIGSTVVERSEWLLYKTVIRNLAKAGVRLPTFGDYAINHPRVSQMDMRLVKPSGTIRYAIDDGWLVVKGRNIRDKKGLADFRKHCRTVMQSAYYTGEGFSEGDSYIYKCANGTASTGNATVWRRVGTSHHLQKVSADIATFFALSKL